MVHVHLVSLRIVSLHVFLICTAVWLLLKLSLLFLSSEVCLLLCVGVCLNRSTLVAVFEEFNIFEILACCFNCSRMLKSNLHSGAVNAFDSFVLGCQTDLVDHQSC